MARFTGFIHEIKGPGLLETVSVADIKHWMAPDAYRRELHILGRNDHWFRVRVSGMLKTWKRDPHRIELPVKYGMYENLRLTSSDFDNGKVAVRIYT